MIETNSQGIEFQLTPWTDNGYGIEWIQIKEELGGTLPTGEACFMYPREEETMTYILDENIGNFYMRDTSEGGFTFTIPIFIYSRGFTKNKLMIKFVCIGNPKFFSNRESGTYTDIDSALSYVYPGQLLLRTTTDQNNNQPIHQCCETGLNFCQRLCYSYKYDTIFGFGFDGLLIKDIIGTNSCGYDESDKDNLTKIVGGGTGNLTNTEPYQLTYNRKGNYNFVNPWTEEDNSLKTTFPDKEPKFVTSIIGSDTYYICRKEYGDLMKNFIRNTTNMETGFTGQYVISGSIMPNDYRLGDIILYDRADDNEIISPDYYTKCLVYSNEFFLGNGLNVVSPSGFNFEWTTELRAVDEGVWSIAPETDENSNI